MFRRNGISYEFHHVGLPTNEVRPNKRYSAQFDMYTRDGDCELIRALHIDSRGKCQNRGRQSHRFLARAEHVAKVGFTPVHKEFNRHGFRNLARERFAANRINPRCQGDRTLFRLPEFQRLFVQPAHEPFPGREKDIKAAHPIAPSPPLLRIRRLPVTV